MTDSKPILLLFAFSMAAACSQPQSKGTLEAVDFTKVEITDNFWSQRVKTNSEVTIPHALKKCESEGRIDNFKFAAGIEDGKWRGSWGFDDSDVYKVLEGMAFTYNVNHDEALLKRMDEIIAYSPMFSEMCADYAAYSEGHSGYRIVQLPEIPLQVSCMNHHSSVKAIEQFLLLRKQVHRHHYQYNGQE